MPVNSARIGGDAVSHRSLPRSDDETIDIDVEDCEYTHHFRI